MPKGGHPFWGWWEGEVLMGVHLMQFIHVGIHAYGISHARNVTPYPWHYNMQKYCDVYSGYFIFTATRTPLPLLV